MNALHGERKFNHETLFVAPFIGVPSLTLVDDYAAEHDINGRALLALDSVGLKSTGVTAFGVRFKLLESVRLLRDDAPPPAHPASPALLNKLEPVSRQCSDLTLSVVALTPLVFAWRSGLVPTERKPDSTYPVLCLPDLPRPVLSDHERIQPLSLFSHADAPKVRLEF